MTILASVVPGQIADDCSDPKPIDCGSDGVSSDKPDDKLTIEFPNFVGDTLPLAGGAILSLDVKDLKIQSTDSINDIISRNLDSLNSLSLKNKLSDLAQSRLFVNAAYLDIARKNIRVVSEKSGKDEKRKAPEVFICKFDGDESLLEDGIANSEIIKICELRFIPQEILTQTVKILTDNSPDFGQVVGVAGRTFSSLSSSGSSLPTPQSLADLASQGLSGLASDAASLLANKSTAVDLVLELFPVFNIDEDDIAKKSGSPVIGGYYTIIDNRLYFKSPDLSGRNSSGFSNGLISEESNLFVEVRSNGRITRCTIEKFQQPPIARINSLPEDFPTLGSSVDLEIETLTDETNFKVFLSHIAPISITQSVKQLELSGESSEIFSLPLLTSPISSGEGRQPTFNGSLLDVQELSEAFASNAAKLAPYFGTIAPLLGDFKPIGYPYFGQLNSLTYYGEQNRPDILLANRGTDQNSSKNDQQYLNPGSYGVLELLTSTRPKLYQDIPSKWIEGSLSTNSETGNLQASFSSLKFSDIDLSALEGEVEFAIYVADDIGQVSRVAGQNLKLAAARPFISKITPNGFFGEPQLIVSEPISLTLSGEDFGTRSDLDQITFLSESGTPIVFLSDSPALLIGNTSIFIDLDNPASVGFSGNQIYQVSVTTLGQKSNSVPIYMSLDSSTVPPPADKILLSFIENDLSSLDFGTNPISGIPLLRDGQSAQIRVKSKSKLFSGEGDLFAYLAFKNSDLTSTSAYSKFSLPEHLRVLKQANYRGDAIDLIIPTNVEYQFSTSLLSDFYKTSNKHATIKFPGNQYSRFNFSGLSNLSESYLILTNRSLVEFETSGGASEITLASTDYGVLKIGDELNFKPGFIEQPVILGLAADTGSADGISSTFESSTYPGVAANSVFSTSLILREINAFENINRLAVIISGVDEKFLSKRYEVKVGNDKLKSKLSFSPTPLDSKTLLFVFDNVKPSQSGVLPVFVEKNDKIFNVKTTSESLYRQATAAIKTLDTGFEFDEQFGTITLSQDISQLIDSDLTSFVNNEQHTSGILGQDNVGEPSHTAEILFQLDKTGILFDKRNTTDTQFKPFLPISLLPSAKLALGLDSTNSDTETNLDIISNTEDVSAISKTTLKLRSGGLYGSGSYLRSIINDLALLFLNVRVQNGASLKFNVPEITAIGIGEFGPGAVLPAFTSETVIPLVVGGKLTVEVRNTERDFILKFDEIILKPRGRPVKISHGVYRAVVEIPATMLGVSLVSGKCFEICASISNADRNRAKSILGRSFVIDLDKEFQDLIGGKLREAMPDIQALVQKIADTPLQFVNVLLDKALIAKDLINSFCDLSFHLLAELKINLDGFRILMIPIQVILCIIDVICALLNPFKLAKAVIRLFQCLYDLILLLPQLAIPAMFIRLILHLLELLECVIEKILFLITAINEISKAITQAIQDKNWAAIKALEEVLNEYLFEIDADLSFLDPILSILALFLELLQLVFRFPCTPSTGQQTPPVCIDGSMMAGIVGAIVAPDLEILPDALIPIGQTYSIADDGSTSAANIVSPVGGNVIAVQSDSSNYLDSMLVDTDSIRGTASGSNGINFNATFGPTFTKSKKGFGKSVKVKFEFKSRGLTQIKEKFIDPNQTVDSPLLLLDESGSQLKLAANGNFISPIDGENFITVKDRKGTVKPLIIDFETPIMEVDENTGEVVQTGTQTISRTFDDIPRMAIMDEEFAVYFIEPEGIDFNDDGFVESITATLISYVAAHKLKFSKEEEELDTNDDNVVDSNDSGDTIDIFDFPQLYFVDMRQAAEQISEACSTSSINTFLFDFQETDTDQIQDIVSTSQECVSNYITNVRNMVGEVRTAQQNGTTLPLIDVNKFQGFNAELTSCLNTAVDDMCRFVVNTLNTSFKVTNDLDLIPLPAFTDGAISNDTLDGLENIDPPFTGAREYAAGDGDSATVQVNSIANILLIPRDCYDIELGGDLTDNVVFEIVSDTTGQAKFILNAEGKIVTKNGFEYTAELTSGATGEVKIKASVCDRTIQAITFDGSESDSTIKDDDCVPDSPALIAGTSPPLGSLIKVDRILTVFFVKKVITVITGGPNAAEVSNTVPQTFGTKLEN